MTNKQRAAKIHKELISQWPKCDALWKDAAFGTGSKDETMGMCGLHTFAHGRWYRPTMWSEAELVPIDFRVTNKHINWYRETAEQELKRAIERSGELEKEIFGAKKKTRTSKTTDNFAALIAELESEATP
jgi:hypothetical protein